MTGDGKKGGAHRKTWQMTAQDRGIVLPHDSCVVDQRGEAKAMHKNDWSQLKRGTEAK